MSARNAGRTAIKAENKNKVFKFLSGQMSSDELAEKMKISKSASYTYLKELSEAGFIQVKKVTCATFYAHHGHNFTHCERKQRKPNVKKRSVIKQVKDENHEQNENLIKKWV